MNRDHPDTGFVLITDTSTHTQESFGFSVIEECVVNALTYPTSYNASGNLSGTTLPVGYYPIKTTSIDLTSGKLIAWLSK